MLTTNRKKRDTVLEDEVLHRLTVDNRFRDDDAYLYVHIMKERNNITDRDFLNKMYKLLKGQPFESISRCRRQIQEKNPNLRGSSYTNRQDCAEKDRQHHLEIKND